MEGGYERVGRGGVVACMRRWVSNFADFFFTASLLGDCVCSPGFVTYIVDQQTTPALIDRCAHRRPPPPSPCVRIFRIISSLAFAVRTALYYPLPLASLLISPSYPAFYISHHQLHHLHQHISHLPSLMFHLPSRMPVPPLLVLFVLSCYITFSSPRLSVRIVSPIVPVPCFVLNTLATLAS